ncbi:hypothetical protein D9M71_795190 [compost metagenome]
MTNRFDAEGMAALAGQLVAEFARQPRQTAETITQLPAYGALIDGAAAAGMTGDDVELDDEFACRSPAWLSTANVDQVRRWTHTLLRIERWNAEWPTAILEALQGGHLEALAVRFYGDVG